MRGTAWTGTAFELYQARHKFLNFPIRADHALQLYSYHQYLMTLPSRTHVIIRFPYLTPEASPKI